MLQNFIFLCFTTMKTNNCNDHLKGGKWIIHIKNGKIMETVFLILAKNNK